MGTSQKRKVMRRRYKSWRYHHDIRRCQNCGKTLRYEIHHFLCNACHNKQRKIRSDFQKIKFLLDLKEGI